MSATTGIEWTDRMKVCSGYAAEHHEDVQAVCTRCHHAREDTR